MVNSFNLTAINQSVINTEDSKNIFEKNIMAATSIVDVIEALNQECIEEVARMKESYELSHKKWLNEVVQVCTDSILVFLAVINLHAVY